MQITWECQGPWIFGFHNQGRRWNPSSSRHLLLYLLQQMFYMYKFIILSFSVDLSDDATQTINSNPHALYTIHTFTTSEMVSIIMRRTVRFSSFMASPQRASSKSILYSDHVLEYLSEISPSVAKTWSWNTSIQLIEATGIERNDGLRR